MARESIVNLLCPLPPAVPSVRPPARSVSTFTKLSPRARPATARTRARASERERVTNRFGELQVARRSRRG